MGPIKAAIQMGGAYAISKKAAQAYGEHEQRVQQQEQAAGHGTNAQQQSPPAASGYSQHESTGEELGTNQFTVVLAHVFKAFLYGQPLNTARHIAPAPHRLAQRDVDPASLYPAHNFSMPIDHFHNESMYEPHMSATFNNRYWFDASHYKKGGPVFVLQSGETDASSRLPYLQSGIIGKLAQATNGIGVILEHRYYGESFPTANLSTQNLRFLTTEQALADQAYFSQHVKLAGLEHVDLTAPATAHIAYGGSYAGAFVAFLRKIYPQVYWGAISSSGVTEAIYDYWQYYEPLREYGPPVCISNQQKLINVADTILMRKNPQQIRQLKTAFGMQTLSYDDDFMNVVGMALGYWQSRNWDPAVNDPTFSYYCGNITSQTLMWPALKSQMPTIKTMIASGGWGNESSTLATPMVNMIGFVNATFLSTCEGETLDKCWGTHNESAPTYADKSLSNYVYLSWPYQYCTEYGFLQTGSGVPQNQLPLISRLLTLEYESLVCKFAFNRTTPPDVQRVNKYGGFNISYPRLALIGGEADPWRPSTPLATLNTLDRLNTTSTTAQPVILIAGAVHHWDENGLLQNATTKSLPPAPVAQAQQMEIDFVKSWMQEWHQQHS